MNSTAKWDFDTTFKFIKLYKRHRCLWDFHSPEYKIKQTRYAAYNSMVLAMDIAAFGAQEVKNKIKNLRSTYQQEIKKMQDSKKPGSGFSSVYVSNIRWLKEMEEVMSKDVNKNVYENIEDGLQLLDPVETTADGFDHEDADGAGAGFGPQITEADEIDEKISVLQDIRKGHKRKLATAAAHEEFVYEEHGARGARSFGSMEPVEPREHMAPREAREHAVFLPEWPSSAELGGASALDEFQIFGQSVAVQLRNIPLVDALRLQLRIQALITEERIKIIQKQNCT